MNRRLAMMLREFPETHLPMVAELRFIVDGLPASDLSSGDIQTAIEVLAEILKSSVVGPVCRGWSSDYEGRRNEALRGLERCGCLLRSIERAVDRFATEPENTDAMREESRLLALIHERTLAAMRRAEKSVQKKANP